MSDHKSHYLAITIGPIYGTMVHAQSTRQLWAASFIFSTWMRILLQKLKKIDGAVILSPDAETVEHTRAYSGAGIWPDRCFLELTEKPVAQMIADLINESLDELSATVHAEKEAKKFFKKYFRIFAVYAAYEKKDLLIDEDSSDPEQEKRDKSVIFKLNKLLDDAELADSYIPNGKNNLVYFLDDKPEENLYLLGFEGSEIPVLIQYDNFQKTKYRFPSLLEIAAVAFRDTEIGHWNEKYSELITREARQFAGEKDQQDQLQAKIIEGLQCKKGKAFLQRHKYIAFVQADGDGIGTLIADIGNETEKIQTFSKKLMAFAQDAAETIAKFGAVPIYVGGDDLLFVSPVGNENNESVLDLLVLLQKDFNKHFGDETPKPSLSFGMSVTYYKHPMEESLHTAYEQLLYHAKSLGTTDHKEQKHKKNALSFILEAHSGSRFGATMHLGLSSFEHFKALSDRSLKKDPKFLSGLIYRLRELDTLLENAVKRDTLDTFFKQHFNELLILGELPEFLVAVKEFVQAVYLDYAKGLPKLSEDSRHKPQSDLIYSCLRFAQFLNAPHHD